MLFGKYLNKYYVKYAIFFLIGILALLWVDYEQVKIPVYLSEITAIFKTGDIDSDRVLHICFLTVLVGVEMFLGRILWRVTIHFASKKIEANLRHDMFVKAEKLPISYYHDNKVGTVMAWFTNDIETIEEFLSWGTVMLVDAIFLTATVLFKMFDARWQIALLICIPLILIVIWGALVEKYMSQKWEERQKYNDELYDFAQESFTGIRVIKAFVRENQQIHAFSKVAKKNKDFNIKFTRISVVFDIVIEVIIAIVSCLLMGFGGFFAFKAIKGQEIALFGTTFMFPLEDLVLFMGYFDYLIYPLIALGQVVSMYSRAKGSLRRIQNFLDTEETIKNPENAINLGVSSGKIEFKNFCFKYRKMKSDYIKNISLTINPGEKIGVVGRIGSGKTSLMHALLRFYNLNRNQVFIDNHDIMDIDIASLRDNIAYVPQDNFLFSDSIKNNIAFSNVDTNLEDVINAAKFSDVDKDITDFPNGYETISGERGVTLSGGQKQRISIARAFIKNAPILILDDSVSAVDVKTEEKILKNITQQRTNKTTIVVASRVSTVAHLDKIIVLNNGELEDFDTPANLEKNCESYKQMVYLQKLESEIEG